MEILLKTQHLRRALGDGTADALGALAAVKVGLLNGLRTLLDDLGTLSEDHLDVARVGHVWVDLVMVSRPSSRRSKWNYSLYRGHGRYVFSALGPG